MATSKTTNDEKFVERDEVFFPNNNVIDSEPFYNNFTTIQNALRYDYQERQAHSVSYFWRKVYLY